jgi:hypothetical protein
MTAKLSRSLLPTPTRPSKLNPSELSPRRPHFQQTMKDSYPPFNNTSCLSGRDKPIVISAQRSGLNFLRVCIETLTGRRTPGKPLILTDGETAFLRTHDAGGVVGRDITHAHIPPRLARLLTTCRRNMNQLTGKNKSLRRYLLHCSPAWHPISRRSSRSRRIALLIRNPVDLFGRELRTSTEWTAWHKLEVFIGNLNRFVRLSKDDKCAFYYEDFTQYPTKMFHVISFLELKTVDGSTVSSNDLEAKWEALRSFGFHAYNKNQRAAGGSLTSRMGGRRPNHHELVSKDLAIRIRGHLCRHLLPRASELLHRYTVPEG